MSLPDVLTIGGRTFDRIDNGKFIARDTTVDEPTYFTIKSNINVDGVSDYLLRFDISANSEVPGVKDSNLAVYLVIRGPMKAFGEQPIEDMTTYLFALASDESTPVPLLTRVLRGEK